MTAEFQLKAAGSPNGELPAQCPNAPRDRPMLDLTAPQLILVLEPYIAALLD